MTIVINGKTDDIKADPDIFFDAVTLPANTTPVDSTELMVNDGTSGVEIVTEYGAIATGASKTLTVTLYHSDVSGTGTGGTAVVIGTVDATAGNVAAGKIRYVPSKQIGLYGIIRLVAGADISEAAGSVYMHSIPNRPE